MIPYPEIDPIAFSIGPLAIRWYGLMYLAGFAGGWWLLRRRARTSGAVFSPEQVDDIVFFAVLGVILGGRLGYVLFYKPMEYLGDPISILRTWEGGMSFHGGLLGVLLAMFWWARKHGSGFWRLIDFIAPVVTIGLGTGRLGNFINGELWGRETDLAIGFRVQEFVGGELVEVSRHASQLYEATLEGLVMFIILWWYSAKPRAAGAVAGLFAILYASFRILVEFVRIPDAHLGHLLGTTWLTMGMVLSLPLLAAGVWLSLRARRQALPA